MTLDWKTCIRAAVTILGVYLVITYWTTFINLLILAIGAAFPLILGCAVAYIANILMSFFERHFFPRSKKKIVRTIKRPISVLLTFISIILVAFLIINMILPEVISCIKVLAESIITTLGQLVAWVETNIPQYAIPSEILEILKGNSANWQEAIGKTISVLLTGVGGAMSSLMTVLTSVFSTAITILVALIFSIYLLLGKEKIIGACDKCMEIYLGKKIKSKVMYVGENLNQAFHSFIVGQCLEAVILGSLCTLGMWILRLPYATMIGCLVGFTALIPMVGAYIGAAVGAFMIFTVSPIQAVVFLVYLIILQQLEGNLIYPRVVGASIGLPGILVLAAVTIGGGVLGIAGMLIGVPLVAAIYKMIQVDIKMRSSRKNIAKN